MKERESHEALRRLADRLERARDLLNVRARDTKDPAEHFRLAGKANGVALALSYVEEMLR